MDMYQKREMRKKQKQEENQEVFHKTNINWVNPTLVNSDTNPLFISKSRNFLFTN